MNMDPNFEDQLFSALRIIEKEAAHAKDPSEKDALNRAYTAIQEAYNIRAQAAAQPDLGWASSSGGWSTE